VTGVLAGALPAVPLLVALVGFLVRDRRTAAALGVAGAAVAFAVAILLAATVHGTAAGGHDLVDLGGLTVRAAYRVDLRAALVAVAVGAVALAVQVYSVTYLHHDGPRYPPYAAQVSLFTAAMLLVVVADDLIALLVGWEVMGICSYLLIGHDRGLPEAPGAAVKAFLVTRVGDVGFLLGIALLAARSGSLAIGTAVQHPSTVAALLILAGVAGKSAQFPLHTWLPDAMAGPTPISALIHAATMVAAGVYVVTRLYPVFTPPALAVLGVMAAVTMLLGALAATAQQDLKRVLAWSTVSQVAYMAGALAVGAPIAALFHLLTHAAFKALLFLAAGAVIHAVGSNLLDRMGGLRPAMPVTFVTMTIGLAALAGVPPMSGFFSKDQVLAAAGAAMLHGGPAPRWVAVLVLAAGLATVALTGWYATRLWLRVFFGPGPSTVDDVVAHDPPPLMRWPLLLLAVPAAGLGFAHLEALDWTTVVAFLFVAAGAWWGWTRWRDGRDPAPAILAAAFHLDAVQRALVVRPVLALAAAVRRTDESIVDGGVESTGRGAYGLGGTVAGWHRAALPRAATAVLGGALLIGLVAAVTEGLR
jgi:NADH-quinone oxidoreductase subunit L